MPKMTVRVERVRPSEVELIEHVEALESRLFELEGRERDSGGLRRALVNAEAERDRHEAMQIFWKAYAADLERTLLDLCRRFGLFEASK